MEFDRVQLSAPTGLADTDDSPLPADASGGDLRHDESVGAAPQVPPDRDPGAPARSGRHRLARLAYVVGVTVLAVLVVVGAEAHAGVIRDGRRLVAVRTELRGAETQLAAVRAELGATTGHSNSAASTLAQETAQLTAVRTKLAGTEADVFDQAIGITDLTTCLSGVQQALNQIAVGNESGGAATLDGVAASCRAVEPSA